MNTDNIEIIDAQENNLKHVDVSIPKGELVVFCGVSGSGKSSLAFDTTKTLREGAIRFSQFSNGWQTYLYQANPKLNADKKLADFTAEEWDYLKYGERESDGTVSKKQVKVEIRSNNTGRVDKVDYEGVVPRFERLYLKRDISKLKKNLQDEILSFVEKGGCPHCGGTGLNPKALESKINGKNIVDYGEMTAAELLGELEKINSPMGISLARQISSYLRRMVDVGIGYLSFSRKTDTLSGGEIQRIKLASELHKKGAVYILDEPSTGLHNKDAEKLLALFKSLVADGNTVIIIEHRLELIAQADYIIEMGLGGGTDGGEVVFAGTPEEILQCEPSKTGLYLRSGI